VPTSHQATLGKLGEDEACRELRRRGYAILARGYRTRCGEVDIIARDGDVLVFVEVKTRSGGAFGSPLEAVTARKRLKLVRMALEYVTRSRLSKVACRFDVVGVLCQAGTTRIEVVVDAFSIQD
jgi:putative endonuclease